MTRKSMIVVLAMLTIMVLAAAVQAAPVPSQLTSEAAGTALSEQQRAAEIELVKATLLDFGLSEEEAESRIDLLTVEEIHALATDLDAIKAGGARTWTTVEVLLALILVALIVD